jgi:hypothetical protein
MRHLAQPIVVPQQALRRGMLSDAKSAKANVQWRDKRDEPVAAARRAHSVRSA